MLSKLCWLCILKLLVAAPLFGQFSLIGGMNISTIQSEHLEGTIQSQIGYQWGGAYLFNPINQSYFHPFTQLSVTRKGYIQKLLGKNYRVNFSYMMYSIGMAYRPVEIFAIHLGMEAGLLLKARQYIEGKTYKAKENYRHGDVGLRSSLSLFENKRVGFYVSYVYGILPILRYQPLDEFGNFLPTVRDIRNRSLEIGLLFTLNPKPYARDP